MELVVEFTDCIENKKMCSQNIYVIYILFLKEAFGMIHREILLEKWGWL